jgi:hypothetical protein
LDGKEAIIQYKNWYMEHYGVKPSEKLIETFCKLKGIDIEKVREREEVAKVEEGMIKHSKLPWKCDYFDNQETGEKLIIYNDEHSIAEVIQPNIEHYLAKENADFIVEACNNYEALETNYNNLLAEFQEVSAIAQEQGNEIEKLEGKADTLANYLAGIIKVMAKHRHILPDDVLVELAEIEKYVEGLGK